MAATRYWKALLLCLVCIGITPLATRAEIKHRFGVGAHYWVSADDIETDNINEDGLAWLITYQIRPIPLLKFEAAVEILPDNFYGATEDVYAPQAYVVLGGWIYGALGIGAFYSDGDFYDDPFYAIRAGIDVPILPHVHVDINANYRFIEWDNINNLDQHIGSDSITVGAAVRIQI